MFTSENLTPTQQASAERSRRFRAHIDEMASRLIAPAPVVFVKPAVVHPPMPRKANWFVIVDERPVDRPRAKRAEPFISEIIDAAAAHFNVRKSDLLSARRTANLILPRHIGMYLAKTMTGRSMPDIGRRFGGRDHTVVIFAVKKLERLIASDPVIAEHVLSIKAQLSVDA